MTDYADLYAIAEGGPRIFKTAGGTLYRFDNVVGQNRRGFIRSDGEIDPTRHDALILVATGAELEALLGDTAEAAIDAIEDGDADDILHAAYYAEVHGGERKTVVHALADRWAEIDAVDGLDRLTEVAG